MTTGQELREFIQQLNLSQEDTCEALGGINVRTLRGWLSAPSRRCHAVPDWVMPELSRVMGQEPHANVDKFVMGVNLTSGPQAKDGAFYLVHTQNPRFICRVVDVNKFVDKGGTVWTSGNRVFKDFQFLDTPIAGVKEVLDQASQIMTDNGIAMY